MSGSTLEALSADILNQLEQHPAFCAAKTILLYHSMKDEVFTHSFIEKWSKSKHILLPVVKGDDLELCSYSTIDDLAIGAYGILEPVGTPFREYDKIDLVIVPGVAFDSSGCRLGRGKGYYDRLLPKIAAPKIGICFPFQLVDEIPTEELDVRMDQVIC